MKQTTPSQASKEFRELKAQKDYSALGWYFWNGFLLATGRRRKRFSAEWHSLTKSEQRKCE